MLDKNKVNRARKVVRAERGTNLLPGFAPQIPGYRKKLNPGGLWEQFLEQNITGMQLSPPASLSTPSQNYWPINGLSSEGWNPESGWLQPPKKEEEFPGPYDPNRSTPELKPEMSGPFGKAMDAWKESDPSGYLNLVNAANNIQSPAELVELTKIMSINGKDVWKELAAAAAKLLNDSKSTTPSTTNWRDEVAPAAFTPTTPEVKPVIPTEKPVNNPNGAPAGPVQKTSVVPDTLAAILLQAALVGDQMQQTTDAINEQNAAIKLENEAKLAAIKTRNTNNALAGVGKGIDMASDLLVDKSEFASDDPTQGTARAAYDSVANSLMAFSPIGTIAGGAMKALGLANDLLGSKSDSFSVDLQTMEQVGGSYGGTSLDIYSAANKAGKKYGLFSFGAKSKANKAIAEAKLKLLAMQGIAKEASDRKATEYLTDQALESYRQRILGGYDQRYTRAAKQGGILQADDNFEIEITFEETPEYKLGGIIDVPEDSWEPIITDDVDILKEGGNIKNPEIEVVETDTTLKSVIPEGALHKNKHHLDKVGVDDSELTKKGIPVVDNNGEQLAEIELNEIIFTLEVTKELEKRYKEFYDEETSNDRKNELALEAGKLLWKEIIYNTDDRTGLIDTLKKGGTIKALSESSKPKQEEKKSELTIDDVKDFDSFYKYLSQTGRTDPNFDYKGFWNDEDMRNEWIEKEKQNPGLAHMNDFYKLPTHYTYSTYSKGGENFGGEWIGDDNVIWIFKASPFNMSQHSFEDMKKYWDRNEPGSILWYGTLFYKSPERLELSEFKNGGELKKLERTQPIEKHSSGGFINSDASDDITYVKFNPVITFSNPESTDDLVTEVLDELMPINTETSSELTSEQTSEDTVDLSNLDDSTGAVDTSSSYLKISGIGKLSFTDMVKKYGEGVIKVTTTHLREKNASYGAKNSWHKKAHPTWKNEDGSAMPMAYDLTPTSGHTFKDLWRVLSKPEWLQWLASQPNGKGGTGWGIIDESTDAIRATHNWTSTGNHIHLGAGSNTWKLYADAMKKYNNITISQSALDYLASLANMPLDNEISSARNGIKI